MEPTDNNEQELHIDHNRIIDQLGHFVPQIHLTLVSILQGIALIYLVNTFAIHPPQGFDPNSFTNALFIHHLYLLHFASFLLLIITWNEFAYATFFLHWPLTGWSTALQFLLTAMEIATITNVDNVGMWVLWLGITCFVGAGIRINNGRIFSSNLFVSEAARNQYEKWNSPLYFTILGLVSLVLGILRETSFAWFVYTVPFLQRQIDIFDFVWPAIAVGTGIATLSIDSRNFIKETNDILVGQNGSDIYRIRHSGTIVFGSRTANVEAIGKQRDRKSGGEV